MTYFQNIHSLADLKKEYRRLALSTTRTRVVTRNHATGEHRVWKVFEAWKENPDIPRPQPDMNMTIREPRQRNTPGMCITNTAERPQLQGSTLLKSWDWGMAQGDLSGIQVLCQTGELPLHPYPVDESADFEAFTKESGKFKVMSTTIISIQTNP